jgi:hypothetical protein
VPVTDGRKIVQRISRLRGDGGQTTAEYVLVLLVAALVVGVLAAVVQSGALRDLFSTVIEGLVERAQG